MRTLCAANIPAELRALSQWVVYRSEIRDGKPKPTKVPYCVDGHTRASSTNPANWASFDAACAAYAWDSTLAGIGFVFSAADPYCGIDLDHCITDGKAVEDWARAIVRELRSYTEWSVSGDGLHIIARAKLPAGSGNKRRIEGAKRADAALEMYDVGRYFVVTGARVADRYATIEARQGEVAALHARYIARPLERSAPVARAIVAIPSDSALLERAQSARNGAAFAALYERGDLSSYADDHSSADAALCAMLAFWTGRDALRIDRLFRSSRLYREKWNRRHSRDGRTYGQITVAFAVAHCREVFELPPLRPPLISQRTAPSAEIIRAALAAEAEHYRRSFRLAADATLSPGQINGIRARVGRRLGLALPPVTINA